MSITSNDFLRMHEGKDFNKKDVERIVKECILNEIRSYFNFFQGELHQNVANYSEEKLNEISSAIKFLFRIEEIREGFIQKQNSEPK